jgi:FtsP/CotA-like multicopper oxidase with cupredoxin domain
VVEPPGGRVAESREYTVVLHNGPSGGVLMNRAPGKLRLAARPGEIVRLRVVDAVAPDMDGGPQAPVLIGAPYRVVALDGHDLDRPQALGPRRLPLGMGQRADLVFRMPARGAVRLLDAEIQGRISAGQAVVPAFRQGAASQTTLTVGDGAAPPPPDLARLPVFDPTRYGAPDPDPVAGRRPDATFPIVLDEHPGFHDGSLALVRTINGQASPVVPPITVREGETVRLDIVNQTGEYHPMHLHGHVLSVVSRDGAPIQGSPLLLDTVLVGPHQTWDVAFVADNPGIWMFHCHVLLHASMGMSTTVNYAGVSTPFRMGTESGNVPE